MKSPKNLSKIAFSLMSVGLLILLTSQAPQQKSYVPSTINDFFLPGSQPLESGTFVDPDVCDNCHGGYDLNVEPAFNWRGSMMAHAQRDPLYLACLAIANQDAPEVGDLCIRCHTPVGWLEGRSQPTNGSALIATDMESVQCHFCHRMIAPSQPGVNPYPNNTLYNTAPGNGSSTYELDQAYLSILPNIPDSSANGGYICDDEDNRRGPLYDPQANHATPYSPYHSESKLCGTCHDVSNPVYEAVKDINGNITGYTPNAFDTPATDFSPYSMFPIERTYSEWLMSDYNSPGGVTGTTFGGNKLFVSTCQDCHMRDVTGKACNKSYAPVRNDLPLHDMTGGNTFIPTLLETLYPDDVNTAALNAGISRTQSMLQQAATVELIVDQTGKSATVKVINETGHKLPSGYPEGRRIWINLKAFNSLTASTYESGAYDLNSGILTKTGTKIYEIKPGLSPGIAGAVGLSPGVSFHFVLNDTIYSDNRIPPRGFSNANFQAIQSPPVGYTYADGQYWDETTYNLPFIPDSIEATLFYQTTSKEYVEFLKDENTTNNAGQVFYDLWDQNGKSAPEVMNYITWSGAPIAESLKLDLHVMMEGPFEGTQMLTTINDQNNLPLTHPFNVSPWNYNGSETVIGIPATDIVDWLLIELRDTDGDASTATSARSIGKQAVFVKSDGSVVATDGTSLPEFNVSVNNNLYVVIWHRNHIGIISANVVLPVGDVYSYNFMISETQTYGGSGTVKELASGIWGMVAADGNADGFVNENDKLNPWMTEAGLSGYFNGDFNMDDQVDNKDKNDYWMINNGYSTFVPN
ncbi:MAG: hypothetical protein KDC09_04415 [Bacteroidales bacterium]|nr:hypothetical protein [Bacteroidales bacterium]